MKNILVIFGGVSCEHDISVITGVLTANCIDKTKYCAVPVYIDSDGKWYSGEALRNIEWYKTADKSKIKSVTLLPWERNIYEIKKGKLKKWKEISCAINCTHGLNGEDGSLAGLLQLCKIPLASPGMFGSSVCMDKCYTKLILAGINVSFLPYVKICKRHYLLKPEIAIKLAEKRLSYPMAVKPANLGSSIGISFARTSEELGAALETAFKYDNKAVVEEGLTGFREINCACYKLKDRYFVSKCEEPVTKNDILTFKDKYSDKGAEKKFPADIDKRFSESIKETTRYVYRKLGLSGIIRIDYFLINDKIYINEINTVPGSLAYYLFTDNLTEFQDILSGLIEDAEERQKNFESNIFTYSSDVLSGGVKYKK